MKSPQVTTGAPSDATRRAHVASRTGAARLRKLFGMVWIDAVALVVIGVIFIVPFIFILMTAAKTRQEAALFEFSWPSQFQLFQNIQEVVVFGNFRILRALWNSTLLTFGSVTVTVLLAAMVAYVMQRRRDRSSSVASSVILAGLIIPPAVVPTIFLLQWLQLYKTLPGLILVEVAFGLPFAILVLRAFMSTIPREIDEAAIIDGASPARVFVSIILPLLQPAIVTVIIVAAVGVYNNFANPLYFLPGEENVTVQLTLYSFISQFSSQWNLLFANVVVITIPPLILFLFFRRQIVAGMTSGGVKG
jgi:raffinose/stachyose/melibiose transport system permease protein